MQCSLHRAYSKGFYSRNFNQRRLVASRVLSGSSKNTDVASLEGWLNANGGTISGVELTYYKHQDGTYDRQLRATQPAAPGACLITVPKHCQVRYDNVDDERLLALFKLLPSGSDTGQAAWQFKQALTLLYHELRGVNDPLHGYLGHLPGKLEGAPTPRIGMLLSDFALSELQYAPLVQDIRNHKFWWDEFSATLAKLPENPESNPFPHTISQEMFGWAVAVVMSRCFGLRRTQAHTMVPLIDMANHDLNSNCEIRSADDGSLSMFAKKEIKAGEPLLLTYGPHDNHHLLLSYGFTMDNNPADRFWFDLDVDLLENLADGLYEASQPGVPVLKPWQLQKLSELGLRPSASIWNGEPPANDASSPLAASSSGPDAPNKPPSASRAQAGSATTTTSASASSGGGNSMAAGNGVNAGASQSSVDEAEMGASSSRGNTTGAGAGGQGVAAAAADGGVTSMRVYLGGQPPVVDPRLLAAVRVATLGPDLEPLVRNMTPEALGRWERPVARQHEINVMQLLSALVTAIYKSFPTTIQQDKALVSQMTGPTVSSPFAAGGPGGFGLIGGDDEATSGGVPVPIPVQLPAGMPGVRAPGLVQGDQGVLLDRGSTAAKRADTLTAVRFRLGMKLMMERCLQALVARAKDLDSLQQKK